MATEEPQVQRQKAQLISAIAQSRLQLAYRLDSAGESLNMVRRVRQSFRDSIWKWLAAAAGSGMIVGLSRPRRLAGAQIARAGILGVGLSTAWTLLKPLSILLLRSAIGPTSAATMNRRDSWLAALLSVARHVTARSPL